MTLHPNASLKETLNVRDPSLAPIFVTDAKALYDSYRRDAVNHGATDKRTNLELLVLREQVEGTGGILKWISSERQFGDGFTKMAARQLLADQIRHGFIKYTWDPTYQASKKKTAQEGAESRNEFSTQLPHHQDHSPPHNSTNHKAVKVGANRTEALETFEPNEMFDTNEASEYEQHSPYEYQPEETFEPAEIQSPAPAMAAARLFAMCVSFGIFPNCPCYKLW